MWRGSLESQSSDEDRGLNMRDRCFSLNCIVISIISPLGETLFCPGKGRPSRTQSHQQSSTNALLELRDLHTGAFQKSDADANQRNGQNQPRQEEGEGACLCIFHQFTGIQAHQLDPSRPGGSRRSFLSDSLTKNVALTGS